jgi:cysteine desulfurase
MIYLDNNATTPLASEVISEMVKSLHYIFGNPSSTHYWGEKAKKTVENARKQLSELIGAKPYEIVFTSGGTESNNMAILGTVLRFTSGHIITSSIEHPSVLNPLKFLGNLGFKVTYLSVDKYGLIHPDVLEKHITKKTVLITMMHSNNETGAIQPISKIGKIAKNRGITFHCDAAQSVGKVPVNVKRLNTDMLTIVSHKFYGPKGIGALYKKIGLKLKPILFGASHEKGLRPGTENVAGIVGLGMAAEIAKKELKNRMQKMRHLSKKLYSEIRIKIPGVKLNGHPTKRLPNTLNLSFPNVKGYILLDRLKNEIAASTGSACHEGRHIPSPVLKAMGISDEEALSAVRLSLGMNNTEAQIKKAAKAIVKAYRSL